MQTNQDSEIDLRLIARRVYRGWYIVVLSTAVTLAIGIALYFYVPRTYQSTVTILPITKSDYSRYANLLASSAVPDALRNLQQPNQEGNQQQQSQPQQNIQLDVFSYTSDDLLEEFAAHLQSPSNLIKAAHESGLDRDSKNQQKEENAVLAFVRSVTLAPPTDRKPGFEMRVRAGSEEALNKFIATSLDTARAEAAMSIRASIINNIDAGENMRRNAISMLTVDIASRQEQANDSRRDDIERLSEEAKIAETLGIADPIAMQAPRNQATPTASAQVIGADQPLYFQGSTALKEQINLLTNRKDSDPYTDGLRDLQRQVYLLENDHKAEALRKLLDESPFKDPATAPLGRYSLVTSAAERVFPRASVFGIASLLLGLVIGFGIVLLRDENYGSESTDLSPKRG